MNALFDTQGKAMVDFKSMSHDELIEWSHRRADCRKPVKGSCHAAFKPVTQEELAVALEACVAADVDIREVVRGSHYHVRRGRKLLNVFPKSGKVFRGPYDLLDLSAVPDANHLAGVVINFDLIYENAMRSGGTPEKVRSESDHREPEPREFREGEQAPF